MRKQLQRHLHAEGKEAAWLRARPPSSQAKSNEPKAIFSIGGFGEQFSIQSQKRPDKAGAPDGHVTIIPRQQISLGIRYVGETALFVA